jgi:hypothetical protein
MRRTSPLGSSTITFETKASWVMVLLQGLGAIVGIVVAAVATPLLLWWIFRQRLGWPKVVTIPIVLLTIAATVAIAVVAGAGAVHERVSIDRDHDLIDLRKRSLTDVVRFDDGHREVVHPGDIHAVEFVYFPNAGAEGPVRPSARVRVHLTAGRSLAVPTGSEPNSAYDVAAAVADLAGVTVRCFEQDEHDSRKAMAC